MAAVSLAASLVVAVAIPGVSAAAFDTVGYAPVLGRVASHDHLLGAFVAPMAGTDLARFEVATRNVASPRTAGGIRLVAPSSLRPQAPTTTTCTGVCTVAIAAGYAHRLELRSDGTVSDWGYNGDGELGLGDLTARMFPTQVGSLTGITAISAGAYHSLALATDKTIWAWGYDGDGELGNGVQSNAQTTPVHLALASVTGMAGGLYHSLAVDASGRVWAWGDNSYGQLGNGTTSTVPSLTPGQVAGITGVVQVAAGAFFSIARKSDGTVWAWGDGLSGQLGNATFTSMTHPVQVSGISTATTVAAGDAHAMALLSDGSVRAWGNNFWGQLGDGTGLNKSTPVRPSLSGVGAIAAGAGHSLSVLSDGTVWNWGYNFASTPALVPSVASVTAVAAGDDPLLALRSDGSVWEWGLVSHATPVQVLGLPSTPGLLVAGGFHTFYTNPIGGFSGVYAWGENGLGQLGNGTTVASSVPIVVNVPATMSAGLFHNIATDHIGTQMYAWGDNLDGELGDGTRISRSTPIAINPGSGIQQQGFAAGGYHSVGCFLDYATRLNTGRAWGYNGNGQLGDGTTTSSPTAVTTLNGGCGTSAGRRDSYGGTQAWGYNGDGELGNGTTVTSSVPVQIQGLPVPSPGTGFGLVNGGFHSFVLSYGNPAYVFGLNSSGQLGTGTTINVTTATANLAISPSPGRTGVGLIAAGGYHTAWLRSDGTVWAFGANDYGQLGNGGTTSSLNPTPVLGLSNVVDVAAGVLSSFAVTNDGRVWQWGAIFETVPTLIAGPPSAPTTVNAIAGNTEATVTWKPTSASGASATNQYLVVASPGGISTLVSPLAPAATVPGLTNGTTYTFSVYAVSERGPGAAAASNPVAPVNVTQGQQVALLPATANAAYGGYTTITYLLNTGTAPASVMVRYFPPGGPLPFGPPGNSVAALPPGATWTLRSDNADAMNAGIAASAIVYSDQPLSVFVNEFSPGNAGDATSYTGIAAGSSSLFAPAIASGAYGGYTTGIGLLNVGSNGGNATITYRDGSGSVAATQMVNIGPYAYAGIYSGSAGQPTDANLPAGFSGTATLTGSNGMLLAAIVNEIGPGGQVSSYDAVPAGSTTLYAPVALNNAYGGYNTGMGIQNTTGTAGMVTIDYYNPGGSATTTTAPIAANGYLGVYQGTDIASAGAYTAKITSTVAIAAIVNEVAPSSTSAKQSTAYNTFGAGSGTLHLPLVESTGSDGWSTGEGIMNAGSSATTVTVTYYDPVTGLQVGTTDSQLLQPNAFWGLYQPAGGLPNGARASAVITTTGQPVAVICNESNSTSFMSYSAS